MEYPQMQNIVFHFFLGLESPLSQVSHVTQTTPYYYKIYLLSNSIHTCLYISIYLDFRLVKCNT